MLGLVVHDKNLPILQGYTHYLSGLNFAKTVTKPTIHVRSEFVEEEKWYRKVLAAGVVPIFKLYLGNAHLFGGSNQRIPTLDRDIEAIACWAGWCAFLFPLAVFELHNESNRSEFWENPDPEHYAKVCNAVTKAIRRMGFEQTVVVGAQSTKPGGLSPDWEWIKRCLGSGVMEGASAFSYHCYPGPLPFSRRVADLERLDGEVRSYLHNDPVDPVLWVTESGSKLGWVSDQVAAVREIVAVCKDRWPLVLYCQDDPLFPVPLMEPI